MKRICIFCSSNLGAKTEYSTVAKQLGTVLANNNIELIYGGANVGLMKVVAEEVLANGGHVTGVITYFLAQKHLTQKNLTHLITVNSMQERKVKMAELADAFIVLPGGFGTLEEIFEVLTAAQLGFHKKPVAIINICGYYDFLKMQLEQMVKEKMLLEPHSSMVQFVDNPKDAFEALCNYKAPVVEKWIEDIRRENGHL